MQWFNLPCVLGRNKSENNRLTHLYLCVRIIDCNRLTHTGPQAHLHAAASLRRNAQREVDAARTELARTQNERAAQMKKLHSNKVCVSSVTLLCIFI
jgi:hypothetical protein